MSIVIRVAEERDIHSILELLQGAGVSTGGVEENIGQFLLVESERLEGNMSVVETVGTVGLEIYEGRYGLMRSLVMKNETWNAQVGVELIRLFFAYAQTKGLEALYLFTKSTAPFFIHMGFSTIPTEELPAALLQSPHYLANVDSGVVAMVKRYASTSYTQGIVDNVNN